MPAEIVLKSDGRTIKRPCELVVSGEVELDFSMPFLEHAKLNISLRVPKCLRIRAHSAPCNLCVLADGPCYVSTRLNALILRATIRVRDGITIPSFEASGNFVELLWPVPPDMRLILAAHAVPGGAGWLIDTLYLFAFDSNKGSWRLPLPNLYEDGRICTGQRDAYTETSLAETFELALLNFREAKWNADILRGEGSEAQKRLLNSETLFRFKTIGTGFESLAPAAHWTSLSEKIGTAILDYVYES